MRNFHTNTVVSSSSHVGHAGAIGRLYSACDYSTSVPAHQTESVPLKHGLEQITMHDMMKRNLQDGITYTEKQFLGLHDSEMIMRELMRSLMQHTNTSGSLHNESKRILFFQAIEALTERKFKSFPLFGYGHESPMRLHLRIKKQRVTHALNPVPLLSMPAFRSVFLTLGLNRDADSHVFQQSIKEILNLMMQVRSEEDRLKELSRKIQSNSERSKLFSDLNKNRGSSFFRKLRSSFNKRFNLKIPRPLPEVPV